jgi:hypothetical protein
VVARPGAPELATERAVHLSVTLRTRGPFQLTADGRAVPLAPLPADRRTYVPLPRGGVGAGPTQRATAHSFVHCCAASPPRWPWCLRSRQRQRLLRPSRASSSCRLRRRSSRCAGPSSCCLTKSRRPRPRCIRHCCGLRSCCWHGGLGQCCRRARPFPPEPPRGRVCRVCGCACVSNTAKVSGRPERQRQAASAGPCASPSFCVVGVRPRGRAPFPTAYRQPAPTLRCAYRRGRNRHEVAVVPVADQHHKEHECVKQVVSAELHRPCLPVHHQAVLRRPQRNLADPRRIAPPRCREHHQLCKYLWSDGVRACRGARTHGPVQGQVAVDGEGRRLRDRGHPPRCRGPHRRHGVAPKTETTGTASNSGLGGARRGSRSFPGREVLGRHHRLVHRTHKPVEDELSVGASPASARVRDASAAPYRRTCASVGWSSVHCWPR